MQKITLQELLAERTNTLKETTAQVMIHFSGIQWRKRRSTPCGANHEYQTGKHHFRRAQKNNFYGCAARLEKDADYRQCMYENSRTNETMDSWDKVASAPQKPHSMTPQQRQEQFGNQWYVVQTTTGRSNTTPTRQYPELGQALRARINYQSVQRATASQAGSFPMKAQ